MLQHVQGQPLKFYCQDGEISRVPFDHLKVMAPATHYLYEWRDYLIECAGADSLRVGDSWVLPAAGSLFRLRFENQLGLTSIQPFAGCRALSEPLHVEVISPKFPAPADHISFYRALLADLFQRAARLPFAISAPTERRVTESLRPATPLFIYHFLCQHSSTLRLALAIVQAAPHHQLVERPAFVTLAEASEVVPEVLINILRAPEELTLAPGFFLAARLRGLAPARVWQGRPEETFDTPENRFTLAFLKQVMNASESLPSERWWSKAPADRQQMVREAAALLRDATRHPMFDEVGAMQRFPASSQVLIKREGYRQILTLWQIFNHTRRPLFEALEQAIKVRDIAQLYEMWAFFALVEEIAATIGESPVFDLQLSDEIGLDRRSGARFGSIGQLVYNANQPSYSVPLRPDFTWKREGRPDVVLDAKFRLERNAIAGLEDDTPQATARRADLYKMHAYRDALGVRAAVSVYPGDVSIFYDRAQRQSGSFTLGDLLLKNLSGIGTLAMSPDKSSKEG